MAEVTQADLSKLLKEIEVLKKAVNGAVDIAEDAGRINRNGRLQSQAEKEYEDKYVRVALEEKYRDKFLPDYEKMIKDAVDIELNVAKPEVKQSAAAAKAKKKIADDKAKLKALESQAKMLVETEAKKTK